MIDDFDTQLQCEEVYTSEVDVSEIAQAHADDVLLEMEVKVMLEII